jgi:NADPH-dependent glutamate synthase beta subunit-like oxidoreductase
MAIVRTHRPVWTAEKCLSCDACRHKCAETVFCELGEEPDSLRGRVSREVTFPPGSLVVPPCRAACHLGQDVPGYLHAIASGDFDRALEIILQNNPMPSVCGYLCVRPCVHACVRGTLDHPVRIRALKLAASQVGSRPIRAPGRELEDRVAVVGSGPAGLSAAFFLRRSGYQVEVYESGDLPGGLLGRAVPAFDLLGEALEKDIQRIMAAGVRVLTSHRVDLRTGPASLLAGGARAVILALGCPVGCRLGLPGEDLDGCHEAVSFAREHKDGQGAAIEGPAVVAGSGHMALAVARMAVRAGARPVHLLMRRSRREAPADPDRLRMAEEEGVQVHEETRPVELIGQGRLEAVRCLPVVYGPVDNSGRRWPVAGLVPNPGTGREMPAKVFIAAEDREPDAESLADLAGFLGTLRADSESMMTPVAGVFGAGEVVTGSRNLVASLASGMRAAECVEAYLKEGQP